MKMRILSIILFCFVILTPTFASTDSSTDDCVRNYNTGVSQVAVANSSSTDLKKIMADLKSYMSSGSYDDDTMCEMIGKAIGLAELTTASFVFAFRRFGLAYIQCSSPHDARAKDIQNRMKTSYKAAKSLYDNLIDAMESDCPNSAKKRSDYPDTLN